MIAFGITTKKYDKNVKRQPTTKGTSAHQKSRGHHKSRKIVLASRILKLLSNKVHHDDRNGHITRIFSITEPRYRHW